MKASVVVWALGALCCFLAKPSLGATFMIDEKSKEPISLPFSLVSGGSLVLCEVPVVGVCTPGEVSDVVVFDAPKDTATMFSDASDGVDAAADITKDHSLPNPIPQPALIRSERSDELNEVFTYTPKVDDPGFALMDETPVTYEISSDVTLAPEPSSILLFGSGLVGAIIFARKGFKLA